jgi:hypothetical protein
MEEKNNFVVIFRTGKPYEFEMAKDVLEENNIPYYTQYYSYTGLRFATPLVRTPGLGSFWDVLVPSNKIEEARAILSELPFEVGFASDPWHFGPTKTVKKFWKIYLLILTVFIVIGLILGLIDVIKGLFFNG